MIVQNLNVYLLVLSKLNMKPKANYVKKRFGLLTVLECVEESTGTNKGGLWLCKCRCRRTITLGGYQLHSRNSCGCLARKAAIERGIYNRKSDTDKAITKAYHKYRIGSGSNDIIAKIDWLLVAEQKCQFCGANEQLNAVRWEDANLVISCDTCTSMKKGMTVGKFKDHITRISEYTQ